MRVILAPDGKVAGVRFGAVSAQEEADLIQLHLEQTECDAPRDRFCPVCRRPRVKPPTQEKP